MRTAYGTPPTNLQQSRNTYFLLQSRVLTLHRSSRYLAGAARPVLCVPNRLASPGKAGRKRKFSVPHIPEPFSGDTISIKIFHKKTRVYKQLTKCKISPMGSPGGCVSPLLFPGRKKTGIPFLYFTRRQRHCPAEVRKRRSFPSGISFPGLTKQRSSWEAPFSPASSARNRYLAPRANLRGTLHHSSTSASAYCPEASGIVFKKGS